MSCLKQSPNTLRSASQEDVDYLNDLGSDPILGQDQLIEVDFADPQAAIDEAVFSGGATGVCTPKVVSDNCHRYPFDLLMNNFFSHK